MASRSNGVSLPRLSASTQFCNPNDSDESQTPLYILFFVYLEERERDI